MSISLMLVLGLALAVNAHDCITNIAAENFDMSKYEGVWYSVAINVLNKTEEALYYEGDTCYVANVTTVEGQIESKLNYIKKGTPMEIIGRLALEDSTKGFFTVKSTTNAIFALPSYQVICTDYNNYAVAYISKQFEAGKCSEMVLIVSRDRTKFAELTSNADVKKCIQDKLKTSVDQFKQIVQNDC